MTPYVGSQACAGCHAAIYASWRKTPMANVVRDPRLHPEAVLGDFHQPNPLVQFNLAQVALVYGSIWKQRYFTKRGGDYYVQPAQWDIGNHRWLPYSVRPGEDWWAPLFPPSNLERPTSQLCDGCHSVGYDIETKTPVEWNVGCERCHGPGRAHAAHPTAANILNPASLDTLSGNDTCIQCHSQGRPLGSIGGKVYDWPVGYRAGLALRDYWKLEDHTLGVTDFYYFADGTAHKNRMQGNDFVQSVMYTRGITCFTCHDVHGTPNPAELRKPPQQLCLTCHGPGSPRGPHTATLSAHTHHPADSPGSQCIACHMPQIEKQGVPGAFVHAHTFKFITPAMTVKYGMSNPCTSCHQDRTPAWASQQVARWYSPWRMQ
ncbi:MAG: cytochrome c3 family protein [Terriglobales bacterium]